MGLLCRYNVVQVRGAAEKRVISERTGVQSLFRKRLQKSRHGERNKRRLH